ncbi:hypothetical protein FACS1894104_3060 [Actinomycetota bacterium]|nr:hypothetical protein FACS1894104_3060 [Actinomycetota bacterium]
MRASRIRLIIAAVATVIVLGIIIVLAVYASSFKIIKEIPEYSTRYNSISAAISNGTGIYQEREYYTADSSSVEIPNNGMLLINPILKPDNEDSVPSIETALYSVTNNNKGQVYLRLSNSKRLNQRLGKLPDAAYLGLSFAESSALNIGWQAAMLYTTDNQDELVDSTLLLGPASTKATSWSRNFSIFFTDGALTDHAVAILPGVNIQNTTDDNGAASAAIYTNRAISIGNLPVSEQDQSAITAITEADTNSQTAVLPVLAVNTNMSISGTDIMLVAPENSPKNSRISPPLFDAAKDPAATTRIAGNTDSANKISISGGVLAVGSNCTLTISQDVNGLGTVDLAPQSILVDGGTLILANSSKSSIKITGDIHVRNGGRLVIEDGPQINGNIYAYAGGTVEVAGSFEIQGQPIDLDGQQIPGGIYIFNNNTYDQNGDILTSGYFAAKRLYMIDGSDGINPFYGHNVVHFLSKEAMPGYPLMYSEYCCIDSLKSNNICPHFGPVTGIRTPDIYLDFSEDTAMVRAFRSSGS